MLSPSPTVGTESAEIQHAQQVLVFAMATLAEQREAEGLVDIAEWLSLLRLRAESTATAS